MEKYFVNSMGTLQVGLKVPFHVSEIFLILAVFSVSLVLRPLLTVRLHANPH